MWTKLISLLKRDDLLTQSLHEAQTMLELDWQMFEASVESLRRSDTAEVRLDIPATDKRVNAAERDIRQKVLTHLVVAGTTNLNAALNLVSVIYDIERIGDFAKGIHELAVHHPGRLHGGSLESPVAEAETAVRSLLQDVVAAFKTSNEDAARAIVTAYKRDIANACDQILRSIISGQAADLAGADAAALALYARFLKRIGAHARNVASGIVNPFPRLRYKEKPSGQSVS